MSVPLNKRRDERRRSLTFSLSLSLSLALSLSLFAIVRRNRVVAAALRER